MKRLTWLGIGLSALWLGLFGAIVYSRVDDVRGLSLNEWGDFLAGASSVLALLWLVIGYLQHGEELRLNTRALELQQEELQNQVKETARLATQAARQAEAAESLAQITERVQRREMLREAREAEPEFIGRGGGHFGTFQEIYIKNRGAEARDAALQYSGPHELALSVPAVWESGDDAVLTLQGPAPVTYPVRFVITCADRLGSRHEMEFDLLESRQLEKVSHTRQRNADS